MATVKGIQLERPVHAEHVSKYRARTFAQATQKLPSEAESKWNQINVAKEPLTLKCIKAIADNFAQYPILDKLEPRFAAMVTKLLPMDLDVTVAALYVHDEEYWERRARHMGWRNLQIAEHGMSWKQLFFERFTAHMLEEFDAASDDVDLLREQIQAAEDYVFQLRVEQLLSHLDLNLLFTHLPNLTALELTYGVKKVGMKYERALFGMKISDATSLASCIRHTQVLTTLTLPRNLLDDDLLRMLMTGLISNTTITALDLSHNKITNHGARMLAKLLGTKSVLMTLNLADNQIHSEGGRYLGRALRHNESLCDLNLRLNRLGDDGGAMVLQGVRSNSTLDTLNLSCNSLSDHSCDLLCAVIQEETCPLSTVDLSGNEFEEDHIAMMVEAASANTTLESVDVRLNQAKMDSDPVQQLCSMARKNELRRRRRIGK